MNCNANKCIACTVQQCAYHCDSADYCSLDNIQVGTHEMHRLQVLPQEVNPVGGGFLLPPFLLLLDERGEISYYL